VRAGPAHRSDAPGPLRAGSNALHVADGKSLKAAYQWIAKSQRRKPPLTGPLEVWSLLYCANREADLDDFNELWADPLAGLTYEDDC